MLPPLNAHTLWKPSIAIALEDPQRMLKNNSLASVPEHDLVKQLLGDPHWRSRILNVKDIPEGSTLCQTLLPKGPGEESKGDVDILVVPPDHPEFATAIEVKRIKVGAKQFSGQPPNKLKEFRKGVGQANKLAEIGFWQAYLYVFVVVDSRENNVGRYKFDGLNQQLSSMIRQVIKPDSLNERVGLMHHEFVQPVDENPLSTGTFEANLIRLARPVNQPEDLTRWVMKAVATGCA